MNMKHSPHKCMNKSLEIRVPGFLNMKLVVVTEPGLSSYRRAELTGGNSDVRKYL